MSVLVGIDVGSSSTKATAVSTDGATLGTATVKYPTYYPHPGWAEQDAGDWYGSACAALRALLQRTGLDPTDVEMVSACGGAHSAALLDADDAPLGPVIHWSDVRSSGQSNEMTADSRSDISRITLHDPNPSWTLAQLMWLRQMQPDLHRRIARFATVKDYVRRRLGGIYATDPYDAIGTQLFDVTLEDWSSSLCELAGIDPVIAPPVLQPSEPAGTISDEAAADTGLRPGTPLIVGSSDTNVEALAAGLLEPGSWLIKLSTSGTILAVTEEPEPSPTRLTYPYLMDDRWISVSVTNSGAGAAGWFLDALLDHERAEDSDEHPVSTLAEIVPAGAEGLLFHPFLMGQRSPRWDPALRGHFLGITPRHRREHFARATLEGVAFALRECQVPMSSLVDEAAHPFLIGGGARSPLWSQIIADVFRRPVLVSRDTTASRGAALLAGVAAGAFSAWDAIPDSGIEAVLFTPDTETAALYEDYFALYVASADVLTEIDHRLGDLARRSSDGSSEIWTG